MTKAELMENVEWFVLFGIDYVCNGDVNDYRKIITLEDCELAYNKMCSLTAK